MNSTPVFRPLDRVTGSVERITFHNAETGFCVLKVYPPTQSQIVTVIGVTLAIQQGESIEAQGEWIQDPKHGKQFRAQSIKIIPPTNLIAIEKYLGSGLIKGIGPHFAKKLVKKFGNKVFEIIESEPEKLLQLGGIGESRQTQLLASWQSQKVMRELMLFLQNHQVSSARAVRIYKRYGDQAIQKIQENPYRLAKEVYGIGFKTADTLAQQMGIALDSPLRAHAGLIQAMQTFSDAGHCAVLMSQLESATQSLLDIPLIAVQKAIEKAIADEKLIQTAKENDTLVALATLYHTEQGVAFQLKRLMSNQNLPWGKLNETDILHLIDSHQHITLSTTQKSVLLKIIQAKVFVLTGGPGVGKTTIVKSLLDIFKQLTNIKICLCAPTGRATQRLMETTQYTAQTIHRLLKFDPSRFRFTHHLENPLTLDLLIVDEASMLDITLTYQLLKAIPSHAAVLFIGDRDQLPSVGPGRVLSDLLSIPHLPCAALTEIFRQAATSSIIVNAHRINQGKMLSVEPSTTLSDFYFIESDTAEDIEKKLMQLIQYRIPTRFKLNPIQDIQILTPMNRGDLGTHRLNQKLQSVLNQNDNPSVERFGLRFLVGDKVMQQVNHYDKEVFNGDVGYIQQINLETSDLTVKFTEKLVNYHFNELDELSLAYAMSIHKSQGSEYPAVIIPVTLQHYRMLARNLLYTGVTRGKKLVILLGQKKALSIAINTTNSQERITQLPQCIQELLN